MLIEVECPLESKFSESVSIKVPISLLENTLGWTVKSIYREDGKNWTEEDFKSIHKVLLEFWEMSEAQCLDRVLTNNAKELLMKYI